MEAGLCCARGRMLIRTLPALCLCLLFFPSPTLPQTPPRSSEPGPPLQQLVVEGTTVYTPEDVTWLLGIREGARLPGPPERIAELLEEQYEREGYTAAEVEADYDA